MEPQMQKQSCKGPEVEAHLCFGWLKSEVVQELVLGALAMLRS